MVLGSFVVQGVKGVVVEWWLAGRGGVGGVVALLHEVQHVGATLSHKVDVYRVNSAYQLEQCLPLPTLACLGTFFSEFHRELEDCGSGSDQGSGSGNELASCVTQSKRKSEHLWWMRLRF